MSRRLAVVAEPEVAALAGLEGDFDWGTVTTVPPGAARPDGFDVVLRLASGRTQAVDGWTVDGSTVDSRRSTVDEDPPAPRGPTGEDPRAPRGPAGEDPPARVISPDGAGAWRRAPWPVADRVFELPPPPWPPRVVVVSSDPARRESITEKLRARFVDVLGRDRLDLATLEAAAAVLVVGEPGAALPAEGMAVLAARRVLVAPRADPAFGLIAGIDHLAWKAEDEGVFYADAVVTHPRAFDSVRALGALVAEHHRASAVYARLVVDIEIEEAAALGPPQADEVSAASSSDDRSSTG